MVCVCQTPYIYCPPVRGISLLNRMASTADSVDTYSTSVRTTASGNPLLSGSSRDVSCIAWPPFAQHHYQEKDDSAESGICRDQDSLDERRVALKEEGGGSNRDLDTEAALTAETPKSVHQRPGTTLEQRRVAPHRQAKGM